jgi:hypothetical protein
MSAYLKTLCEDLYIKPVFMELDDCYQQGQAASDQAFPQEGNPYVKFTAQYQWWDAGWINSLEELTKAE